MKMVFIPMSDEKLMGHNMSPTPTLKYISVLQWQYNKQLPRKYEQHRSDRIVSLITNHLSPIKRGNSEMLLPLFLFIGARAGT